MSSGKTSSMMVARSSVGRVDSGDDLGGLLAARWAAFLLARWVALDLGFFAMLDGCLCIDDAILRSKFSLTRCEIIYVELC